MARLCAIPSIGPIRAAELLGRINLYVGEDFICHAPFVKNLFNESSCSPTRERMYTSPE